jgi:hypothetical protein
VKGDTARLVGRGSILLAALFAVLAVRVVVGSHDELALAERFRARGDIDTSIVHYRRAVRFYAPGNPYVSDALVALVRTARDAEAAGNPTRALAAWRAVHAGILAGRSFYVPHRDVLVEADAHIAALTAVDSPPVDVAHGQEGRRRAYLAALVRARDSDPSLFWTLVLLAGFAAWLGGALGLVLRGVDLEARLVRTEARRFGVIMLVGFFAFVLGLALA